MNFNISNEEKITITKNAINILNQNAYSIIVSAGQNPDTFILGEISDENTPEINSLYEQISAINTKILNLNTLIESLT